MRERCVRALSSRLSQRSTHAAHYPGFPSYATCLSEQLLPSVEQADFLEDLDGGDGGELEARNSSPPKFLAAFSSSALAVNCFGPFRRHLPDLRIPRLGDATRLDFERVCRTRTRGGRHPNLDVIIEGSQSIVAIESKCLEYLTPKVPKFAASYDKLFNALPSESRWRGVIERARKASTPLHLDVAQLVKHYLGLRHTFLGLDSRRVTLLYLYWEPVNAGEFTLFESHRAQALELVEATSDDDIPMATCNYNQLWDLWDSHPCPPWLMTHLRDLRSRYTVAV